MTARFNNRFNNPATYCILVNLYMLYLYLVSECTQLMYLNDLCTICGYGVSYSVDRLSSG